jgi:hypothetical protein
MSRKSIRFYVLLALIVLISFGCKKKNSNEDGIIQDYTQDNPTVTLQPTDTAEGNTVTEIPEDTNHDGEMRSYLSGLWVPIEVGTKRPYAFQFNNFKTVKNQWGIGQADIVYECLVEGGITRLLGIGENYTGDRIGSTRSARHYFVSIADEYDAIYIHYGGTKYATSKIKELGIDEMDGNSGIGTTVFYRDSSIKAPHNAFASLDGILKGIEKKGFETKYEEGYEPHYTFYEEDTDFTSGTAVNKITVDFSSYNLPYFEYNATDKLYYRFQFGAAHIDSLTGNQLTFKNIIIQFVKEWNIDKNGYQTMDLEDASGSGYYITNGKMIPITWKKKEASRWMRYYNEAGEELTINPGKTYIALFPNNRTEDVKVE